MGTSEIVALCSLAVAAIALLLGGRRDTRTTASEQATTSAKLDAIQTGVDEIRIDQRAMRDRVDVLGERVASVEASAKSMHRRLDEHIKNVNMHPPDHHGGGWTMQEGR